MPWKHMDPKWDTSYPESEDVKNGYKTIHSKLWKVHAQPCDIDSVIGRTWYKTLGHMESFYAQIPFRDERKRFRRQNAIERGGRLNSALRTRRKNEHAGMG